MDSVIHLFNNWDQKVRRAQIKGSRQRSGGCGREKGRNFPASRGLFPNTRDRLLDEEAHFSFSLFFPLLLNISMIILIKKVEAEDS